MSGQASGPNRTLFQSFEWHTPSSPPNNHYLRLRRILPTLSSLGITAIWLPPGCKANSPQGNGYDCYDLWDLGEFEQKGARSTKWGSREELNDLMKVAERENIEIVWDAVLSHKTAGDATDESWAVEVDSKDRRLEICPPKKIEAWLRYDFPGREREAMKYSKMKWRAEHFNGTDWDQRRQKHAIYKLIDDPATHPMPNAKITRISETSKSRYSFFSKLSSSTSKKSSASSSVQPPVRSTAVSPIKRRGKGWAEDVDDQNGNNDYLMFSNIDYTHADVRQDVKAWGEWMLSNDVGVAGFRLDAVQHISYSFMREWIQHVNNASVKSKRKDAFIIGEVWSGEPERITKWLDAVQHASGHPRIHAFDAPLLYNFSHLTDAVHHQATTKIRDNTNIQTRSSSNARASSMNPKDANLDSARNPSLISPSHPPPDLRNLAKNSILELRPEAAVTVVTNHDTQTGQTSYTPMEPKLKILFYAFVLLRQEGLPCVFWGDLFGTQGPYPEPPIGVVNAARSKGQRSLLADLLVCRKIFAYGTQMLYSWAASTVGWTRSGVPDRSGSGCAVILNIEPRDPAVGAKALNMKIGRPGEVWVDALMPDGGGVQIDGKGWGAFPVMTPGVRVFVRSDAQGVEKFPVELNLDVYGL